MDRRKFCRTAIAAGVAASYPLLSACSRSEPPVATSANTSIRGISESLAEGKGSMGMLLSDEALYLELQSLLREGRAAVDDMRETSPITTFSSIFFGVF